MVGLHDGRFAGWGIRTPAHVIGTQPGLVAPEDHPALPPCPGYDRRILMAQPVPHFGRVLLIRSPQRLLRGETPACQVLAGGTHRQAHAILAPNEGTHRVPAPQRKIQTQLIGHVAADQPLDRRLLRRIQQPLLIRLAATLAATRPFLPLASKRWQMSNTPVWLSPTWAPMAA